MANETLKRDSNYVTVLGGITDDANQEIRMLRVDPATGRVLASATGAGSGDVTGPGSSTDNAVVRWDGAAGTDVQDSVVIIGDTGNITGVGTLNTHTIQGGTSTLAMYSNKLSVFAATTSAELAGVISNETGSGLLVFGTAPTFATNITVGTAGATTGSILIKGTTSGTVTLKTADAAGTYSLTLPTDDGTNGQVLTTDGAGVLTWTTSSGTGDVVGPGSSTDLAVARFDGVTGKLLQDSTLALGDTGPLYPFTNDTVALGDATHQFSDLFLAEGGVINWDGGDATLTQAGNVVTLAGADLVADTVTVNTALMPDANDGAALGASGTGFSDLFLAEGGVINWDGGDATITQTSNDITVAGISTFGVGTSTAVTLGTIELGDASDTTIARVSAGVASIEGVTIATATNTLTLSGKTLTAPKFVDLGYIADANGNEMLVFDTVAAAVPYLQLSNNSTGNNPVLTGAGEANTGIDFLTSGTGTFRFLGNSTQAAELRLYEDTDAGTNYTAFKVGTQAGDVTYTLPVADGSSGNFLSTDGSGTLSWAAGTATSISATYTAEENLTIGNRVGISALVDNSVSKALRTIPSAAMGITNAATANHNAQQCAIGTDKFVYMLYDTTGSGTIYAQVGTINRSSQTITLGTAVAAAAAFTPVDTAINNAAICKLDTDKFVMFYLLDSSTTVIKYRAATVSGTTITFGTEATFVTAASTVATSASWGADFLSTDKGIMFYKAATATNSRMVCFTASGTVLTAGTQQAPGTNSDDNVLSYVRTIGTDKYVLCTRVSNSSHYAQVCTVSGTTITAGSEVQISTTSGSGGAAAGDLHVASPTTDVFVYHDAGSSSSDSNLTCCTVSGTTPTAGSTIVTPCNSDGAVYSVSASEVWVMGPGAGNLANVEKITISGSALTDAGGIHNWGTTSNVSIHGGVIQGLGYAAILTRNSASTLTLIYAGLSNHFIGIAQSTQSRGASVSVLISGVDANQSGLSGGAMYRVGLDGALSVVGSSLTISNLSNTYNIKAADATHAIIGK